MVKVYYVTCPKCSWRYYVGAALLQVENFPTVCPKCKHEFPPEESSTGIEG